MSTSVQTPAVEAGTSHAPVEGMTHTERTWSDEQERVFGWFANPEINPATGRLMNLLVRARAGCGKTTTILEGVRRAPEGSPVLAAFGTAIKDELNTRLRLGGKGEARTLHSLGNGCVQRYWSGVTVCKKGERGIALTEAACGQKVPDAVKKLVTRLHGLARETAPLAQGPEDLVDLALTYECEPDEEWVAEGYDVDYVAACAYKAMVAAAATKPIATGIDFSDMIYLPIRNGWLRPTYDLVVVDEAQDMSNAQLLIAQGICKGRICIVGDDRQAIYGFRGADSGSLDRLKAELHAKELGLKTTYRCGQVIVNLAAQLVPDFQAAASNPEGEVESLHTSKMIDAVQEGDFLLSRTNAPLVLAAISLLRQGKRARIKGKDLGKSLKATVTKLAKGRAKDSLPELIGKLQAWKTREVAKMVKAEREDKVEAITDTAEMLVELAEGSSGIPELLEKIEALFTDNGLGHAGVVTCSSVHRAKGLEANRVFVLADTLKTHSEEELNIQYVAITRAKQTLVMVSANAPAAQ